MQEDDVPVPEVPTEQLYLRAIPHHRAPAERSALYAREPDKRQRPHIDGEETSDASTSYGSFVAVSTTVSATMPGKRWG